MFKKKPVVEGSERPGLAWRHRPRGETLAVRAETYPQPEREPYRDPLWRRLAERLFDGPLNPDVIRARARPLAVARRALAHAETQRDMWRDRFGDMDARCSHELESARGYRRRIKELEEACAQTAEVLNANDATVLNLTEDMEARRKRAEINAKPPTGLEATSLGYYDGQVEAFNVIVHRLITDLHPHETRTLVAEAGPANPRDRSGVDYRRITGRLDAALRKSVPRGGCTCGMVGPDAADVSQHHKDCEEAVLWRRENQGAK